jgi:hypothetical protein
MKEIILNIYFKMRVLNEFKNPQITQVSVEGQTRILEKYFCTFYFFSSFNALERGYIQVSKFYEILYRFVIIHKCLTLGCQLTVCLKSAFMGSELPPYTLMIVRPVLVS